MIKSELYHHGVKGQKWGVRRFQNPNGSLTSAGKKQAKTWTKELNKNEKANAKIYGKIYKESQTKNNFDIARERAKTKGKVDKAERYLEKSKVQQMKIDKLNSEYKNNRKNIDATKKLISKNSEFMITYHDGYVISDIKSIGIATTITTTGYSKSKVRANNDKNNKRYANKKQEHGHGITKNTFYYY